MSHTTHSAAGIILITHVRGRKCVIGRTRGVWNGKKGHAESWPGCLQVSAFGKYKDREDATACVTREMHQELGISETTARCIASQMVEVSIHKLPDQQHITYFAAFIPPNVIDSRNEAITSCLVPLEPADLNDLLTIEDAYRDSADWRVKMRFVRMPIGTFSFRDTLDALREVASRIDEFPKVVFPEDV